MAENEDEPEALSGAETLALAREGKDAWNAWAVENEDREVDFSGLNFAHVEYEAISFEGFTFPGEVHFSRARFQDARFDGATFKGDARFDGATFEGGARFVDATFEGYAWFVNATFEGDIGFDEATFEGYAGFDGATFEGGARFEGTTFEGDARFQGAAFKGDAWFDGPIFKGDADFGGGTFTGPVSLENSQFRTVPDFRRSEFQKHLTLHGIEVDFRRPTEKTDADKYRRLKELAVNARDHDREQMFFSYELMAKRGHETRGLALIPNYLYEWTSNFGRSLWRPTVGLLAVWFAFGNHYRWLASKDMDHLSDGLLFSTAQLFPFISASKGVLAEAKVALFGTGTVGNWVNTFSVIEGLLGIVFLFLIGLTLRNRFRI